VSTIASGTSGISYRGSCDYTIYGGTCSSNLSCKCAAAATGERICTQKMNCEDLETCDPKGKCIKANSTCVVDSRCDGQHLCFPNTSFSRDACPPIPTVTISRRKKRAAKPAAAHCQRSTTKSPRQKPPKWSNETLVLVMIRNYKRNEFRLSSASLHATMITQRIPFDQMASLSSK
jgi:hypothetical protein